MDTNRSALEQQLNLAIQRYGNHTVLFTNAISQQIGLSASEFECYSLLMDEGPLTAGQLATKCGLSTGGITGLVTRLEHAGFVRRHRDPNDKRRVIVTPIHNKKIHQKLIALYRPVGTAFDESVKQYSEKELRVVINFLNRGSDMVSGLLGDMKQKY